MDTQLDDRVVYAMGGGVRPEDVGDRLGTDTGSTAASLAQGARVHQQLPLRVQLADLSLQFLSLQLDNV